MRLILEKQPHTLNVWTAAEKEKVKDLFYEGYTDEEIGNKIGRTAKAVGVQRCHMRLRKKRQPPKTFCIHDAMADYYPKWYMQHLKREWEKEQLMCSMS